MDILAIETSGSVGGVALARDGAILAARDLSQAGRRRASTLASDVADLLRGQGAAPASMAAVAVSIGPGSFTGLRVGVVFAKVWAYATGCRLVPIDTLRAIAQNAPADIDDVWVLSDALRGDVYAGRYRRAAPDALFTLGEPIALVAAADWLAARAPGEVCVGPGTSQLNASAARTLRILDTPRDRPRAETIVRLGWDAFQRNEWADPASLEPYYLRRPAAEETRDMADAAKPDAP